jgi:hypothetical protein
MGLLRRIKEAIFCITVLIFVQRCRLRGELLLEGLGARFRLDLLR